MGSLLFYSISVLFSSSKRRGISNAYIYLVMFFFLLSVMVDIVNICLDLKIFVQGENI